MTDKSPQERKHATPRRRRSSESPAPDAVDAPVVAEAPTDTVSAGTEGVSQPVEASAPAEPAPVSPPARRAGAQPKKRIRNMLGQPVTCSVLSEDGSTSSVRLPANGLSDPYPESHITDYTRGLVSRGHLQLVR